MPGASAIRPRWIAACQEADEPLCEELEFALQRGALPGDRSATFSAAQRLVAVLQRERETAQRRAKALDRILAQR